jgi:4-hydroxy-L-threonine phosphate dehydrogenase PdxA
MILVKYCEKALQQAKYKTLEGSVIMPSNKEILRQAGISDTDWDNA